MKSFTDLDQFLLPHQYHKYGLISVFAGIPMVLLVMTLIVFSIDDPNFKEYWDIWGGYLLHLPLSLGFFWMFFSREKEEDEMYFQLRLKATFHGIRFIFIAILMLPGFSMLFQWVTGQELQLPDIGGNLAVVTLILAYAYGTYWWLKRSLEADEE